MFIVCVNNIFIDMFVGVMDVGKQRQVMGAQKGKWWGPKTAHGRSKNGKWWGLKKASGGVKKRQVVGAKNRKWW